MSAISKPGITKTCNVKTRESVSPAMPRRRRTLGRSPELSGAVSAMARAVFDEWSLAHSMNEFKTWLDQGPPSDDADEGKRKHHNPDQGERQ